MYDVAVRPVRKEDAAKLAEELTADMRAEDAAEEALFGQDPYDDVKESIERSAECWEARRDGTLLCVYGIVQGKKNLVWMLAAEAVKGSRKALVAVGYDFIRKSVMKYGPLTNWISAENTKAVRYIRGTDRIPGLKTELFREQWNGEELVHFEIRREPCAE